METEGTLNRTESTAAPGDDSFFDDEDFLEVVQKVVIVFVIVNSLITFLGLIGNGLVISVIVFKMKKTVNAVWFLNLTAADFLFLLFLPLHITERVLHSHWPFGSVMCKLTYTVLRLNMFASVFTLTVISVDRCVSVVWPVWSQNQRTVQKASCVSVCVWLLAFAFCAPYLNFTIHEVTGKLLCTVDPDAMNQQVIEIISLTVGFLIPLSTIVFCYAVIIHHLGKNPNLARNLKRTIKKIAVVILTFFLCWAPYHTTRFFWIVVYITDQHSRLTHRVITFAYPVVTSLAFLNSCLNPLLYVFLSPDFRDKARGSILNVLSSVYTENSSL